MILIYSREKFPYYDVVESERGTPVFVHDENTKFSPEELVAQLFAKAKEFAEISQGELIVLKIVCIVLCYIKN